MSHVDVKSMFQFNIKMAHSIKIVWKRKYFFYDTIINRVSWTRTHIRTMFQTNDYFNWNYCYSFTPSVDKQSWTGFCFLDGIDRTFVFAVNVVEIIRLFSFLAAAKTNEPFSFSCALWTISKVSSRIYRKKNKTAPKIVVNWGIFSFFASSSARSDRTRKQQK